MSLLECSINGAEIDLRPAAGTLLARCHAAAGETTETVTEHTTCNYGLAPEHESVMSSHGMVIAGIDGLHEVRAVERDDHPFFVATLYQPQLRSRPDRPHPVFIGLVDAAASLV